jgi:hypothetical protein
MTRKEVVTRKKGFLARSSSHERKDTRSMRATGSEILHISICDLLATFALEQRIKYHEQKYIILGGVVLGGAVPR